MARRDATGQSSRGVELAIIRTLLPWAILGAARDAQSLTDRRLGRDVTLRVLLRDGDVARRAWGPAG